MKHMVKMRGMRMDTPEAHEALRTGALKRQRPCKYSLMLLDEALRVAKEVGPAEAARQTGVNVESIKKHAQRAKRAAGIAPDAKYRRPKYSDDLKRRVIVAALRYKENTSSASIMDCFKRSCVNNGLPASAAPSIFVQYHQGTFSL